MSDFDWAVGFIEGEGSFYANGRRGGGTPTPVAKATQINKEPLDRLISMFGGSLCEDKRQRDGDGKLHQWEWRLTGKRAVEFSHAVYPVMSSRRREQIDRVLIACALPIPII